MSVKRSVGVENNGDKAVPTEPGVSSLKELDSNKLKAEIKRWAKAVVGYARQLSGRLGRSSRKSNRYGSSRSSSSHAA
ncbi:hypothetical protein HRI_003606600 [Hibiscus trionum]|uniref:Uncharacterized protein n=1 Tax=Hibiscus trionum TaxID=183268 RepID=A0A9W7IQB2_HIBTR|nr:hypothetical protein HRI_003606600 [Hibiscus trionum]